MAKAATKAQVRAGEQSGYRCQFCGATSPAKTWKRGGDKCPMCGRVYDAMLAQEGDDG